MPHHIIRACIVRRVKPYQLIAALMHAEGLGSLPFAKKLGKPGLQSQIHRFVNGGVDEPANSTAQPIAAYFKLPLEAMYQEKVATAIARERGITELPPAPPAPARKRKQATTPFDRDTMKIASRYAKLPAEARRQFWHLLQAAEAGAASKPQEVMDPAGHRPQFGTDPGESQAGGLDEITKSQPTKGKR